jgi:hypothetical protein
MPGGVGGGVGPAGGASIPAAGGAPAGGASAGPQDHPANGQTVQQPPGTAKNTTDFNDYLFNNPSMIPIVGPNMGLNAEEIQLAQAQVKWAHEHPNQPMSPDFASVGALKNYETVQAELGKDRLDAQTNLQKNIDQTARGQDAITRLKNNPQLEAALAALRQPWRGGQHLEDMMLSWRVTNPQLYEAIRDIQFLGDQTYAESFTSAGTKRTQQEVKALKESLSQVNTAHYTRGQDYIEKVLNPLDDSFSSNLASNYGLSGQLDAMPKHLRPYTNPIYGPGQPLYGGTGGGWMSKHLNMRGMTNDEAANARKQLEPGDIYFDNDGKLKQVPEAKQ